MKISVVTISYNNLNGLKITVPSVTRQDYSDLEFIIVDGGSTDGSKDYIEKETKFGRISFWVSEPDNGLYDAMNKGLGYASGKYIIFMNSGDRFFKCNSLSNLVEGALLNDSDVVYGSALYSYPDGLVLRKPQAINIMVSELPFCHQAVMVKTELAKKAPFNTKLRFIADYEMFYKFWKSGKSFQEVHSIISIYDASGVSSHKSNRREMYLEKCMVRDIKPSKIAYSYIVAKAVAKDILRFIIPIRLRDVLKKREVGILDKHPLEYYEKRFAQ